MRVWQLSILALGLLALTGPGAVAAPQILGIVASNGLPMPLHCEKGYCSARLASFCLQEGRYAPNSSSEYRLAPGSRLTILADLGNGRSLRIPGESLLTIRTSSGFTALSVSLPEAKLKALGAVSAAVDVGPGTTVLPVAWAGDPHPQTAEEIAAATGPLRHLAARTFEDSSEAADSARLIALVIDRLPEQAAAAPRWISALWSEVAETARRHGLSPGSIAAAGAVIADCQEGEAPGSASWWSGICLGMREAELMTDLNRQFWDEAAGGS